MGLDDLIKDVERMAPSDDPLDQLATATLRYAELTHQADALVDHFVGQAREAGCPWSRIGETLGVTKQAAQQKHAPEKAGWRGWLMKQAGKATSTGMFARFTNRARTVMTQCQEEARELQHNYVGTEHILLAILADTESIGAKVLLARDIDHDHVRTAVVDLIGEGGAAPSGHIPFTPRSQKTLERALTEALQFGHNYIGTEHIVLGLMQNDGVAQQIIEAKGVTYDDLRSAVIEALSGYVVKQQDDEGDAERDDEPG